MPNTETYIVKEKRMITAEQQHLCDTCMEPATHGCTDATETVDGWTQSETRYGCASHVCVSVVRYLNGTS